MRNVSMRSYVLQISQLALRTNSILMNFILNGRSLFGRHFWHAISPIGIDVTISWSVCLSRSCIVFKRQKISTRFLLHTTASSSSIFQIVLKFSL